MTDTKNKIRNSVLDSKYLASEERHRQFAREMEGELVISLTPNQTLPTQTDSWSSIPSVPADDPIFKAGFGVGERRSRPLSKGTKASDTEQD